MTFARLCRKHHLAKLSLASEFSGTKPEEVEGCPKYGESRQLETRMVHEKLFRLSNALRFPCSFPSADL